MKYSRAGRQATDKTTEMKSKKNQQFSCVIFFLNCNNEHISEEYKNTKLPHRKSFDLRARVSQKTGSPKMLSYLLQIKTTSYSFKMYKTNCKLRSD